MEDSCTECDRLWREYAARTYAHLRLVSKQRIAALQNDSASVSILDRREHEAEKERSDARAAFKAHESAHSPAA